ncbi:hypothetical protein A0H81_02706, partial [Grifola frondosa]
YGSKGGFQIPHNIVPPLSSWSIQVQITLEEAQAEYTVFQIDSHNQPDWYVAKVNPARKIPALTYGGPKVPPEDPSPESVKIAESLVILEFIADLFPEAHLLPTDRVLRAKARFFINAVETKFIPAFLAFIFRSGAVDDLLASAEALQALLPPTSGYAVGAWSVADAAFAPFLAALTLALENEIGTYVEGEGRKTADILRSAKFARLQRYLKDLKARPSFQKTWAEVGCASAPAYGTSAEYDALYLG